MGRTPLFRKLVLALQTARREILSSENLPLPLPRNVSNWSRRKFIKSTAVTSAAGLVSGCLSFPKAVQALPNKPVIAIIGAGIAGLNAAYRLKKAGHSAVVYEARSRIGGRMNSVDMGNGLIVDIGAELINTDHADMLELVEEFGIELFNRKDDQASLSYPLSAYFFNGFSITESQLAGDLRAIAEQMTTDAALLDQDWDTFAPQFDKLSVKDYLELHADKIGKPYLYALFRDVIHTEFGVEPEQSSAIQFILVLPVIDGKAVDLLSYSDETYSVVGGSAKITDALGADLAGQIQLSKKLIEIKRHAKKFKLEFSDHSIVFADLVIIAIPFPVLDKVKINAPLPKLLRRFIKEAELGSNEKVIAGFSKRFWRQANGFTDAAWSDLGFSEVWDETQRQSDRQDGALNFFLGGDQARSLGSRQEAIKLGKQFIARLNHFIPGATSSSTGQILNSAWTLSPLTTGGYANYKPGQLTRFGGLFWVESDIPDESQQVNVGNLILAGEHLSDAFYGFMNGAAQTGRLAADLVLEKIAVS
ncbi:MAG: FAD-dependent oxidoreductase [Methylococcaceae bacterium]|nr:FAD-dependent oxidoreductase [Methylococcaceae bacterium]